MTSRLLLPATSLLLAFIILAISLFSSSSLSYKITDLPTPLPEGPMTQDKFYVSYELPSINASYAEPLRIFRAIRDRVDLLLTFDVLQKSQVLLDHSNDRLSIGEMLIRDGKINEGLASIARSQVYLEKAFQSAKNQEGFRAQNLMTEISLASLKHRERIESLMSIMPDEARSFTVEYLESTKYIYTESKLALEIKGLKAPSSPFETSGN